MHNRTAGAYPLALAVALIVALSASFFAAQEAPRVSNGAPAGPGGPAGASYGDNALACTLPTNTPSYLSSLVPRVVQTQAFITATNAIPYVFDHTSNYSTGWITIGGKIVPGPLGNFSIIGGNTTITPPGTEIVFLSYGPGTSCEGNNLNAPIGQIVVEVPIENGAYNMTGIVVHPLAPYVPGPIPGG